jgi:hypothetical protein
MKYAFILAIFFCGLAHAEAPRCNPGDYSPTVNWQVGVSADQSIVSILWCNDSSGLTWWAAGWNPAESPINACAGNIKSQSAATMMAAFWANCLAGAGTTLTSPQQTAVNLLVQRWIPKLETPGERLVYQYANGALVGRALGVTAAHALCGKTVVATNAKGEDYYDVSGEHYDYGGVIPPNSAAPCSLVAPPAAGW